ncbi:MAG: tRNA (adenosine(37)-N6)-threonylcarbamoyltransferase complex ATPase subunit type 1 TsaE [Veillonella sp.]|uniref:tRNA (adenosine(37)-N6)-threonylcarbamoyltransferase complex ATPase subunit type 1 TsaE n=1 Tax=Veillonella sp. TaxID=1926307 RepID=UPI0025DE51EF|nr:tRNA (adenosine(37)-N6)-threonylcarbamoyltransferase complex ATPase subunit type 1 TsaE [Veillonella sp.]MBS4912721.1 tRNA (adenosine(37)-N6)-threonylcarbamoyltransferase complex ATPase subunit type 1 TsaE [Veillonella sp.]
MSYQTKQTITCHTDSVEDTMQLGRQLGEFLKTYRKPLCMALVGDLGTGKTHMSQGIARGFGVREEVTSPTFALMNTYNTAYGILYHFDVYRLDVEAELDNIGFAEFTEDTLSIVEWADKFPDALPLEVMWIRIEKTDDSSRQIVFETTELGTDELEAIGGSYVFRN